MEMNSILVRRIIFIDGQNCYIDNDPKKSCPGLSISSDEPCNKFIYCNYYDENLEEKKISRNPTARTVIKRYEKCITDARRLEKSDG